MKDVKDVILDRIKDGTIRNHTIQMDGYYNSKEREVTETTQFRKFLRCKTGCIVNDISKKAGVI